MSVEQLLPCPFCGDEVTMNQHAYTKKYSVGCDCFVESQTRQHESDTNAAQCWNRRIGTQLHWQDLDSFDAVSGDVVLRRWRTRESGNYKYALIECWNGRDDYLLGNEFVVIDDGSNSDTGLRAMEYWSRQPDEQQLSPTTTRIGSVVGTRTIAQSWMACALLFNGVRFPSDAIL